MHLINRRRHQWIITRRGWSFKHGEPVPIVHGRGIAFCSAWRNTGVRSSYARGFFSESGCFIAGWFGVVGRSGGCGKNSSSVVVIYTSQDEVYAEPILHQFEQETGIQVEKVYDSEAVKTVGLVNRLLAERDNPQCDVFWNNGGISHAAIGGARDISRDQCMDSPGLSQPAAGNQY